MTHYMNQAAKDWLLRALEVIHQEFPAETGNAEALQHALYEEIKALPVIDAGDDEAEAALERVRNVGLPPHGTPVVQFNRDIATISARLRAARASHTTEDTQQPSDNDSPGLRAAKMISAEDGRRSPDWSVTAKNRKAVEEMEASFNKHSQEEIENVYESLARLVAHAGASVTYPKGLRRGDELEILGFLPPRPEPAAKPKETQG